MTNETNYSVMIKEVKTAVKFAGDVENKWQNAGKEVLAYFGSAKALDECKAQFQADAILPAIDAKHAKALAVDLPRKGSKEFEALPDSEKTKWELVNQAKKDARAICGTYFNRVKGYAYGKEKKESTKKSFAEKISALIVEGGKITECDFDLVKVMGFLIQAEQVIKQAK